MPTSVRPSAPRPVKSPPSVRILPFLDRRVVRLPPSTLLNGAAIDVRLLDAVIDVERERTMKMASLLTLTVADPDYEVLRSQILNQQIDLDLRPFGGQQWVYDRLRSIGGYSHDGNVLTIRFWDLESATLKLINTPRRWDGQRTDLRSLVADLCREANRISPGLGLRPEVPNPGDVLSPVAPIVRRVLKRADGTTSDVGPVPRTGFAGTSSRVVMFGKQLGDEQMRNADVALTVAAKEKASLAATLALCMACIQEPATRDGGKLPFGNPPYGHSSSVGILQLLDLHYGGSVKARMDVERVCRQFLRTGFTGTGGAMQIARQNRGISAAEIAARAQGNLRGAVDYAPHRELAEDVIRAWQSAMNRQVWDVASGKVSRPSAKARQAAGGTTTTTTEQKLKRLHRPTEWRRGESGKPESSWTMLDRYGKSFGRRRFVSEDRLVLADDDQLIRSVPHMTFAVGDPNLVTRPSFEIDGPGGLKDLQFTALAAWWSAPPGSVVDVQGAGPADGPWLVGTVRDRAGSHTVDVELMQPATEDPDRQTRTIKTVTREEEPTGHSGNSPGPSSPATRGTLPANRGADGLVDAAAELARRVTDSSVFVVSAYRPGSTTTSGNGSDHASNNDRQAARDIAVRGIDALVGPPSPKLDAAVAAIGKALGRNYGDGRRTIIDTFQWKGYRVQIIWRTPKYGGHMGHIHIGARKA